VLIVPPSWEGDRIDYALEACEAYPGRFGIMARCVNDAIGYWVQETAVLGRSRRGHPGLSP